MKNLSVFIFLSIFSFVAFGQEEKPVEQAEAKVAKEEAKPAEEKQEAAKEEAKPAEEKQEAAKEEAKPAKEKQEAAKEEAKPAKEKQEAAKEEAKPAEAKQEAAKEEAKPAKEKQEAAKEEAKPAEEKPAAVVQESDDGSAVSVQTGMKYECDGGRSYTLHEPGTSSESNLCELDAEHTEAPADWYALNQSSFCRQKLQELIELYNCAVK